jgi:hypothetical protein
MEAFASKRRYTRHEVTASGIGGLLGRDEAGCFELGEKLEEGGWSFLVGQEAEAAAFGHVVDAL